jgi:hypothetical protein
VSSHPKSKLCLDDESQIFILCDMAEERYNISEGSEPHLRQVQKEATPQYNVYIPSVIRFILGLISSVALVVGGVWWLSEMKYGDHSFMVFLLVATGTVLPVILAGKRRGFWIGFGVGILSIIGLVVWFIYFILPQVREL